MRKRQFKIIKIQFRTRDQKRGAKGGREGEREGAKKRAWKDPRTNQELLPTFVVDQVSGKVVTLERISLVNNERKDASGREKKL